LISTPIAADHAHRDEQQHRVGHRREDGPAAHAVGATHGRRPAREHGGSPREQQPEHVAQVVRRVRDQGHRVRQHPEHRLDHHEAEVEPYADAEGRAGDRHRVVVTTVVFLIVARVVVVVVVGMLRVVVVVVGVGHQCSVGDDSATDAPGGHRLTIGVWMR
jgi:hypothetical protein